MSTTTKINYAKETKALIKDGINRLGGELTNLNTFREYKEALDNIYDRLPKVTGTGSDLSLTPTLKGALGILPLGNAEQDGTPTPDNPIDVKVVTGDNQVVVANKNIFDGEIENGSINPDDGSLTEVANRTRSKNYTKVSPNTTYTITRTNNLGILWIVGYNSNKQGITDGMIEHPSGIAQSNTAETTLTFTTTATTEYIKWYQTTGAGLNEHIQIEVGSTATSYVAHQEQSTTLHLGDTYLAGIGDVRDELNTESKKKIAKIGKAILNENSGWGLLQENTDYGLYYMTKSDKAIGTSNILSDLFTVKNVSNENCISGRSNNQAIVICLAKTICNYDLTAFKSWISNNNVTLYYQLAEPTEETIIDTTLINELNGLQELLSYDGTTNITITSDSDNAQMLVQVSALKGE